jgi:hypothetical protein
VAYNLYDLGIKGNEIKRRLNLLKDVSDNAGVATNSALQKASQDIQNA